MFWKRKKEVVKNSVEEKEIKGENKGLNNENFPNSVEIKDLELGKLYFRIEVDSNDIEFKKVMIVRKGLQLPISYGGWLLSTQVCNYVIWSEVDTSFYKYNGDLNDLLHEKHLDDKYCGPFDDTHLDSDYNLNKKLAFFDITSNLNDIKDNITEFWQKLANKVLKEKKEYYDRQLERDKNDLIKNFNESLKGFTEEEVIE